MLREVSQMVEIHPEPSHIPRWVGSLARPTLYLAHSLPFCIKIKARQPSLRKSIYSV